jgi:hypothetical protein
MFSSFSCVLGVLLWWFLSSVVRLLAAAGDFFWSDWLALMKAVLMNTYSPVRLSLRTAVDRFCSTCKNGNVFDIANCDRVTCPLHPVRPNQSLQGSTPMDFSDEDTMQEVEDCLDYDELRSQIG